MIIKITGQFLYFPTKKLTFGSSITETLKVDNLIYLEKHMKSSLFIAPTDE